MNPNTFGVVRPNLTCNELATQFNWPQIEDQDFSIYMNIHSILRFAVLLLSLHLLTGCGQKEDNKPATQVAARVNSDEITVHQINNSLGQTNILKPESAAQAKRAVLESLINQQLAKQRAIEAKLDRSPKVVQAIENARAEILARAHLDSIARTLSKPAAWDVQSYYEKHPELFAQRRVFSLEQVVFEADAKTVTELDKLLSGHRPLEEITEWLHSQGVKTSINRGVRAAEQIPLEMLPKLQSLKKGEVGLFANANVRFQLIKVLDFMVDPMNEATATPYIEKFLYNRTVAEAVAREMSEIRKQAKIEYLGEFAGGPTATQTEGKPAPK